MIEYCKAVFNGKIRVTIFYMTSEREKGLRLNKRLMFGTRLFIEFKSINAVVQLFYLSRGLNVGQIILLSLVWTATSFVTDVPSSYLADKFGRKRLIMTGILLTSLSIFLLFFANSFLFFILTYIIGAAGYSFFMGADHAIIYDSLKELGEEKHASRVAGKYFSSASLPKIFMPLLGSVIAKGLLPWQFMVLIVIDFVGSIISFVISSKLTEPKVEKARVAKFGILKEGFKLINSDPVLLRMALNKITIFQATFVYWRIYQVILKGAGMSVIALGAIYMVFQGILFAMFWNTNKVQKFVGKYNFMLWPQILGLLAIIATLLTSNLVVLFISCVILLTIGTIRDPLFLSLMQARIPSFNRATATSTLNTIKNISDIPLLLLVGYLANINNSYILIISIILFASALLLTPIKKGELDIQKE